MFYRNEIYANKIHTSYHIIEDEKARMTYEAREAIIQGLSIEVIKQITKLTESEISKIKDMVEKEQH